MEDVLKNSSVKRIMTELHLADADFIKSVSGISIGGWSPIGWLHDGTLNNPVPMIVGD